MDDPTETQIEHALESAVKYAVGREQILLTVQRYLYGDLTAGEGMVELSHIYDLIDDWRLDKPLPFGEIE